MRLPIVIIGAGGHAKVVVEIIDSMGIYEIFGCTDLKKDNTLKEYGIHYVGSDDDLKSIFGNVKCAAMGVGGISNLYRQNLYQKIKSMGFQFPVLRHKSCLISKDVSIEEATVIMPGVIINPGTKIGTNVIINTGAVVEHDCIIEDSAQIGPGAILCGGVKIAKRAYIGAGACILPGISIDEDTIVGAGAVVTKNLKSNSKVVGNPAREIM